MHLSGGPRASVGLSRASAAGQSTACDVREGIPMTEAVLCSPRAGHDYEVSESHRTGMTLFFTLTCARCGNVEQSRFPAVAR